MITRCYTSTPVKSLDSLYLFTSQKIKCIIRERRISISGACHSSIRETCLDELLNSLRHDMYQNSQKHWKITHKYAKTMQPQENIHQVQASLYSICSRTLGWIMRSKDKLRAFVSLYLRALPAASIPTLTSRSRHKPFHKANVRITCLRTSVHNQDKRTQTPTRQRKLSSN